MPTSPHEIPYNRREFWTEWPEVFSVLAHPEWDVSGLGISSLTRTKFIQNGNVSTTIARGITNRMITEGWSAPAVPAGSLDLHSVPNGMYVLSALDNSETLFYKIYTITRGRWVGRRVIKFWSADNPDRDDRYSAFAFLNCDGSFTLWSRFEERADELVVQYVPTLIEMITRWMAAGYHYSYINSDQRDADSYRYGGNILHINLTCRECNAADVITIQQHCREHTLRSAEELDQILEEEETASLSHLAMCEVTHTEIQ